MSRNEQMIRFLKMIQFLKDNPNGYTINELATHFNVNAKTIRRDLAAMREAGINLVENLRNESKCFKIVEDQFKPSHQ